jgi:hypothetical protein
MITLAIFNLICQASKTQHQRLLITQNHPVLSCVIQSQVKKFFLGTADNKASWVQ